VDEATGETKDLGVLDAGQVLRFAVGVANGSEYMQRLMQIGGGGRVQGQQGGQRELRVTPEKVPSIGQRASDLNAMKEYTTAVGTPPAGIVPSHEEVIENTPPGNHTGVAPWDPLRWRVTEEPKGPDEEPLVRFPKQFKSSLDNISVGIVNANNIPPRDAALITAALADPNHNRFDTVRADASGATLRMADGYEVRIPANTFAEAMAVRGRMKRMRGEWEEKAEAAANKDLEFKGREYRADQRMDTAVGRLRAAQDAARPASRRRERNTPMWKRAKAVETGEEDGSAPEQWPGNGEIPKPAIGYPG
jgi:hypothetical protein